MFDRVINMSLVIYLFIYLFILYMTCKGQLQKFAEKRLKKRQWCNSLKWN